jgi:hypothetical protein
MNHRRRARERSRNATRPSIELTIQELIVEGVEPAQRYPLGEAVRSELTRLLKDEGLSRQALIPSAPDKVDGGAISIQPGERGAAVGDRIARAIYSGLNNAAPKTANLV